MKYNITEQVQNQVQYSDNGLLNSEISECNDQIYDMLRLNTNWAVNIVNGIVYDWTVGATNNR